jgi:hypothetical protein
MEQIAGLARVLADRIGALFGVLDLSFFVAGGVTLLAFTFVVLGVDPHAGGTLAPSLVGAAAILLSYSCGLVSMSLGRMVRRRLVGPWRRAPPEASLGAALARQLCDLGLNTHAYFSPHFVDVKLNDGRPAALTQRQVTRFVRLYAHLWAVLRQEKALAPSLEQLNALWVRSAVMDGLVAARGGLGSDWRLKGLRAGAAATACNGLAVVAATGANGAAERETSCWGSDQRGGELLSAGRGEPPAAPPGPWPVVLPEVRPPAPLPVGLRSVGIRPAGPSQPCPPLMVQEPWAAQAAGAARDRARGRDQGTAARRYLGSPRHWPPAAGRARVFAVG